MLLDVDPTFGAFSHRCEHCGLVREYLRIHPQHGDLHASYHPVHGASLQVTCPACSSVECFRTDIAPHEAGEGHHPDSLVGLRFPDTGGVVTEHDLDGSSHPTHRQQAQHILALVRHPAIAPLLQST